MTLFWLSLAGCLAVALVVAGWRAQQKRTAVHNEWLRGVLLSDREVQEIEQWYQQESRERDGEPRA